MPGDKRPPASWWNSKVEEVRKGNPAYTKEIVDQTVGKIWSDMSKGQKEYRRSSINKYMDYEVTLLDNASDKEYTYTIRHNQTKEEAMKKAMKEHGSSNVTIVKVEPYRSVHGSIRGREGKTYGPAKESSLNTTSSRIEDDTPIMPWIVADSVIDMFLQMIPEENAEILDKIYAAKEELSNYLADRAQKIYDNNPNWKKMINGKGNKGRDALYSFMQHWLSGEIVNKFPEAEKFLTSDFMRGASMNKEAGNKYYLKVWTGPSFVKEIAEKAKECGYAVTEGTEHIYVTSEGSEPHAAEHNFLVDLRRKFGTDFGLQPKTMRQEASMNKTSAVFKDLFNSDYVKWMEKEVEIIAMSQGPWTSVEEANKFIDLATKKIVRAVKAGVEEEVVRLINEVREDILETMTEGLKGNLTPQQIVQPQPLQTAIGHLEEPKPIHKVISHLRNAQHFPNDPEDSDWGEDRGYSVGFTFRIDPEATDLIAEFEKENSNVDFDSAKEAEKLFGTGEGTIELHDIEGDSGIGYSWEGEFSNWISKEQLQKINDIVNSNDTGGYTIELPNGVDLTDFHATKGHWGRPQSVVDFDRWEEAFDLTAKKINKEALRLRPLGPNRNEVEVGDWLVLFSYQTPVCAIHTSTGEAIKTDKRWSNTTARHINQWLGGMEAKAVPQEELENLVQSGGIKEEPVVEEKAMIDYVDREDSPLTKGGARPFDRSAEGGKLEELTDKDWQHIRSTVNDLSMEIDLDSTLPYEGKELPEEVIMTSIGYVTVGVLGGGESEAFVSGYGETLNFSIDPFGDMRKSIGEVDVSGKRRRSPYLSHMRRRKLSNVIKELEEKKE